MSTCKDHVSPSSLGRVRCKCVIWQSCPMYERIAQEYILQYTPETMQGMRDYNLQRLATIPGHDGTFLKPNPNFYLDTYLAEYKGKLERVFNPAKNKSEVKRVYTPFDLLIVTDTSSGKGWYEFVRTRKKKYRNLPDGLKLDSFNFLTIPSQYSDTLLRVKSLRNSRSGKVVDSHPLGGHQTFVTCGSIYDIQTLRFDDYNIRTLPNMTESEISKLFLPKWGYKLVDKSRQKVNSTRNQTTTQSQATDTQDTTRRGGRDALLCPVILGIEQFADPVAVFTSAGIKDDNNRTYNSDNVYKLQNINPGLHWGLGKRLMISPGAGFSLSFFSQTQDATKVADPRHQYLMKTEFAWLDPFQNNIVNDCAYIDAQGNYNIENFKEAQQENIRQYNLATQVYILVKLPKDVYNHTYGPRTQNLYLLIAENSPPKILRDSGYVEECQAISQNYTETSDCGTVNVNVSGGGRRSFYLWRKKAIEIARCDFANSAELLSAEHLQINFRLHLGKLVITFNTYEDQYWVITNTQHIPPYKIANVGITEPTIVSTPFRFTLSQIYVYGGNKKYAFNYSPLVYESSNSFDVDNISFQGPIRENETEFLLREKKQPITKLGEVRPPPFYQSNYATTYYEYAYDGRPEYVSNCNWDAAYNLSKEAKENIEKSRKEYPPVTSYAKLQNNKSVQRYTANQDAVYFGVEPAETAILLRAYPCPVAESDVFSFAHRYEPRRYKLTVNLVAGSVFMPDFDFSPPANDEEAEEEADDVFLAFSDTPILSNIRAHAYANGCAWNKSPVDVSDYVMSFSDEWSETDFQKIAHSGNISFLISPAAKSNINNFLYNLTDKTFYLQISIWWEKKTNAYLSKMTDDEVFDTQRAELRQQVLDRVMFTGICHGGRYAIENNKEVLQCQLHDYSKILQDQVFFNSPFFDRMTDIYAIHEILSMAGFRDGFDNSSTYEPASFIRELVKQYTWLSEAKDLDFIFNGERVKVRNYVLPGSYDLLQSPLLKFPDDSPYWSAIEKISLMSSKIAYFDRFGVFRFENMPFDNYLYNLNNGVTQDSSESEQAAINSIYERASKNCYVASLRDNLESQKIKQQQEENGENSDSQGNKAQCFKNPETSASLVLIQNYDWEYIVSDVKNEIRVVTATPNGELLIAGDLNYRSLYDPDSAGFVGFKKTFIQMDGIFGSEDTVKMMVNHYTKMYRPPLKISFKTFGRNNLKVLDAITVQGLGNTVDQKQPFIITSIKNEVSPENNTWYQNIEALWLFSGKNIQFGRTNTVGVGLDGSVSNL